MSFEKRSTFVLEVLHSSTELGALAACLVVGSILTPVARHWHMPFAPIGFASVVSMIPCVFLFRMASGLVQLANGSHTTLQFLGATIADVTAAGGIILAMSFGLLIPKLVIDHFAESHSQDFSRQHADISSDSALRQAADEGAAPWLRESQN